MLTSELLSFQQVFFVESVCDDPEVIAANILVWSYVTLWDIKVWLWLWVKPISY